MDVLNIKSKLMKKAISKVLSDTIRKKIGISAKISIEDLQVTHTESGNIAFSLKVTGDMPETEISKFI